MTTAIILAAGLGSRLRPLTDTLPKCLVSLGDETILGRQVRLLRAAGIERFVLSAGHAAEALASAVGALGIAAEIVHNPDFATTQNIVSLHRALGAARGDVIKLDGDVVFGEALVPRVVGGTGACVAVDGRQPVRDEAMKVRGERGLAVEFGKSLDARRATGESIGIEWFDAVACDVLRAVVADAIAGGRTDAYYEDVYGEVIARGVGMRIAHVDDLPWTEVDDHADLARARCIAHETRAPG